MELRPAGDFGNRGTEKARVKTPDPESKDAGQRSQQQHEKLMSALGFFGRFTPRSE